MSTIQISPVTLRERLRRAICSVPVLVGLVAILPYSTLLLTGSMVLADSLYSDYGSFQVPMREFVQSEFFAGRFPHWIPWVACGIPMHATLQTGICYPLLTPLLLVLSANMAIKVSLVLHIILCYIGQYRLSRMLGISTAGAAISALIMTQNGFLTSHLAVGHVAMVLDAGLVPWLYISIVSMCRRPSWGATAGFAATVGGMLLIAHPQIPYYALLFGGLWTAVSLVCGAAARHRVAVCSHFAVALVAGILIGGIQLLPTFELARDNRGLSGRGTEAYGMDYALDGIDVCRMALPTLRGNPLVGIPEFRPPDFFHEKVCYLGLLTWLLVLIAALRPITDRWVYAAILLSIFSLLISLGGETPMFSLIGKVVPGLFLFRCPGRSLGVASMLVALLAGRGFDQLSIRPSTTRFSRIVTLFLVADLLAMFLLDQVVDEFDWNRWSYFATHRLQSEFQISIALLLVSIAFVRYQSQFSQRTRCALAVAILAADLGYFNIRCIQFQPDVTNELPAMVMEDSGLYRYMETGNFPRFSKDGVRYSRLVPQAVRRQVRMLGTNEGGLLPAGCELLFVELQENSLETLRIASCRDVISPSTNPMWTRIDDVLPRVRFLAKSAELAQATLPAQKKDPSFSRDGSTSQRSVVEKPALDESDLDESPAEGANESHVADAEIVVVTDEPQLLVIHIKTEVAGTLSVSDTFYPGWTATIDEAPCPISCVANSFRGVEVPAGDHVIRMQYHSESFVQGMKLTAIGFGALLVFCWLARRERRLARGETGFGDDDAAENGPTSGTANDFVVGL